MKNLYAAGYGPRRGRAMKPPRQPLPHPKQRRGSRPPSSPQSPRWNRRQYSYGPPGCDKFRAPEGRTAPPCVKRLDGRPRPDHVFCWARSAGYCWWWPTDHAAQSADAPSSTTRSRPSALPPCGCSLLRPSAHNRRHGARSRTRPPPAPQPSIPATSTRWASRRDGQEAKPTR